MTKEQGVLPEIPLISKGKCLTKEDKHFVARFFEDDSISRQCPGKKDYISVRDEAGTKQQKQKRLVLGNLKEVYQKFKELDQHPDIGFSTFCTLRPKHCILAGSSGTHSVCVCTYHQNPLLQLNAIGEECLQLTDVMKKAVCDINSDVCMMRTCKECPGEQGVVEFVQALPSMEDKDELRYKKWVSVDRCTLQEVVESADDFLASFSSAIVKLLRHHFVAQKQSEAFKLAKENLHSGEGVLVGDFAENHSFLVQDAAQGFHWDNSQCTLHPFVFYFKDQDANLQHKSFCFVSDLTKHSTAMVHTFLKTLIPTLKDNHPQLSKIIYFSDGCAGQYKNRYNFINLLHHEADFGLKGEWNFFATSHGKNACDGIGGTLKRCVTRASLQRPYSNQILTAIDFFNYCRETISSIQCFFTSTAEVELVATNLEARFETALTVPGTQKHHFFAPLDNHHIQIAEISLASYPRKKVRVGKMGQDSPAIPESISLSLVRSYVVVKDSLKMWVGYVEHQDEEFGDYLVRFLHPHGVRASYSFPSDDREQCFKGQDQIVGALPEPSLVGGTRVRYSFPRQMLVSLMIRQS